MSNLSGTSSPEVPRPAAQGTTRGDTAIPASTTTTRGRGTRDDDTTAKPRLEIAHAHLQYGELEVLRDVSLTVSDREIVSIVGPSGCGKTSLLRCAAGLTSLSMGAVSVDGTLVTKPLPGVCMVFQNFGLFPWKNVWNNVAYGLKIAHAPAEEIARRVSAAIELVGLSKFEKSYPRQLSGGMQQRTGLARALVMEPRLLLMDEPFSAIDAQTRDQLQFELLRIWDERPTAMLFVTHSIDEAVLMGHRVVVLAGRPSHVRQVFDVDLPHPRDRSVLSSSTFIETREAVWRLLFEQATFTV